MVILIFIFLTPKSWFASSERPRNTLHQSPQTVLLSSEVISNEADRGQIEQRVKAMTGRSEVEILAVRPLVDSEGRTRSFEVDIR